MFKKLEKLERWEPPQNWRVIKTLDTHTAGEPLRIIVSGFPEFQEKLFSKKGGI